MVARLRLFAVLVVGLAVLAACGTPQTPVKVELSVVVAGTGAGTVTSNPDGIDSAAGELVAEFDEGTQVTLTAAAAAGSTFAGFSGATCEAGSAADTCVITLDEATDVTATFTLAPAGPSLTVVLAGDGDGAVTSVPAGIDTDAGETSFAFPLGTEVTLTAAAAAGSIFVDFTGVTCEAGSTADTCVITFDAATTVTATFEPTTATAELVVDIVAAGAAAGSVTSTPAGIDTAGGSSSATFQVGTTVTLTAEVTAEGFAGWTGGDCAGRKTLVCEVVVGASEPAVTANFNAVQTLTVAVAANADDAVEFLTASLTSPVTNPAGWVWANWQRFDLGFDPNHAQTEVGLRFPNVGIPTDANVLAANLRVTAYDLGTGTAGDLALAVRGQLATDAAGFPQDPNEVPSSDITGRTARTTASTTWNISGAWANNTAYESPAITSVVQEIVALSGWTADGNVVLFLSNTDPLNVESRRVWSYDGANAEPARLPTLLIEYVALP